MRLKKSGIFIIANDRKLYEIIHTQQCDPDIDKDGPFYYEGYSYIAKAFNNRKTQRVFYESDILKRVTKEENPEYFL